MKPSEHPEFYRLAPPEGRSRESTIRLDREGHFTHDGAPVEHPKLRDAMHTWIKRHPDDGRYILDNGYDWTYVTIDEAPFFVTHLKLGSGAPTLALSDGTEEELNEPLTEAADGALFTQVKRQLPGGPFDAKFSRHAQTELSPLLEERDGHAVVRVGEREIVVSSRKNAS